VTYYSVYYCADFCFSIKGTYMASALPMVTTPVKSHHHHHSFVELGHLLTRSGLTHPEVSLTVYHDFFCQLENIVS